MRLGALAIDEPVPDFRQLRDRHEEVQRVGVDLDARHQGQGIRSVRACRPTDDLGNSGLKGGGRHPPDNPVVLPASGALL